MAAKEGPLFNVHGFYFHAEDVPHLCQVEGCGGPRKQAMLDAFPALLLAAQRLMRVVQATPTCPLCRKRACDCWEAEAGVLADVAELA